MDDGTAKARIGVVVDTNEGTGVGGAAVDTDGGMAVGSVVGGVVVVATSKVR